ncbi:MAG: glycosyltransferase family 2 protein [Candidatus Omnitrophica bacterium]|nr:glycosyltransferase family 2 protein [Candidatus Omnitrophota bacterium]
MNICAVIPSYNAKRTIKPIISALKKINIKVIVVDDGSTDKTEEIAKEEGAIVLRHRKNEGKGAALRNGFNYVISNTDCDAIITLDSDGQHDPESIPSFITLAYSDEKIGVVVGNRMNHAKNMPRIRILTNKFMSWAISKLCRQEIPDSQCGFRLVKCHVLKNIKLMTSNFEVESETLIRASRLGYKIASMPIESIYSRKIISKINPIIDTCRFFIFIAKEIWISLF